MVVLCTGCVAYSYTVCPIFMLTIGIIETVREIQQSLNEKSSLIVQGWLLNGAKQIFKIHLICLFAAQDKPVLVKTF